MTIAFNNRVVEKYNLTLSEIELLHIIGQGADLEELKKSLTKKGLLSRSYEKGLPKGYFITIKASDIVNKVILESDQPEVQIPKSRVEELIEKVRELYPEGRKQGTPYYWRGNRVDIKNKLLAFFKKYGDTYSDDDIISATKDYVEGFRGDYRFMKLLEYFIWKKDNTTSTFVSELANCLENKESTPNKGDWTSIIR